MKRTLVLVTLLSLLTPMPALRAQASQGYAEQLLDRHRYREAAQVLEDMAARAGADSHVYEMLADAYLGLKQPQKAAGAIERGMRSQPGDTELESYYVALLRRTRPRSEVQKSVFDIFNVYPQSPVFQKAAARLLYEANPQDEKAGALLAMAARDLPDDAEVHFFFGQWLCLNQREPACVEELTTAAERTEEDNKTALAQIWAMLGTAQMNMGHAEEASKAWARALRANDASPRPSPELNLRYSAFLRKADRESEADRVLREMLRRYPDFGPAHFEAAQVAFSRSDNDTAVREAVKALEFRGYHDDARSDIHLFLASVYANAGRLAEAERERAWVADHTRSRTAENVSSQTQP